MDRLFAGYRFFARHVYPALEKDFQRLKNGQKPEALFITCADSRIVPTLCTTASPGDLFMLRNVGNIIPKYKGQKSSSEAATIEYALDSSSGLGIKHIVVCGHSQCGAMQGLLKPQATAAMTSVTKWLSHARQALINARKKNPKAHFEQQLKHTIEENVLLQVKHLKTHPTVAKHLKDGSLTIHAWIYTFETGKISSFDARKGGFFPLEESPEFLSQAPIKTAPLSIQSKL